jgi:hypothetical protein
MSIEKYFNRGVTALDSPLVGHVVKETDHNLEVFGENNERFDIPVSENKTGLNDNRIMNLQGDKDSGNDYSNNVLDDLLKYTFEIRRSNNPEKYGVWKSRIERVIEKTYGSDSIELKQIKGAMKLNFLTTSGQSEEQRRIYFNNLYERRFNRTEQLISQFKLDQVNQVRK